jgi:hypothetical protein
MLPDQTYAAPTALQINFIRYQGRRALKNGHLPLALIVRAFSAFLECCNKNVLFAENQRFTGLVQSEGPLYREEFNKKDSHERLL